MRKHARSASPSPTLALLCLLAAGCGSVNAPLRVDDSSTTQLSVRGTVGLGATGSSRMEWSGEGFRASGNQALGNLEQATVGGTLYTGPVTLAQHARVQRAYLGYNHLLFAQRPVQMEWTAGLASQRLQWRAQSDAAIPSVGLRRVEWTGLAGGVLGRWVAGDTWALEARWVGGVRGTELLDDHWARRELAWAWRPVRRGPLDGTGFGLRVGLADQSLSVGALRFNESALLLRARGPFLELHLGF